MSSRQELRNRAALGAFLALLGVVLAFNLAMAGPYLLALFMGAVLAMISHPAYVALRARGLPRRAAALLVTAGGAVLVIGPIAAFLSLAATQGVTMARYLAAHEELTVKSAVEGLVHWPPLGGVIGSQAELQRQVRELTHGAATAMTAFVVTAAAGIPLLALQLALACLGWFFMLQDGEDFLSWLVGKLPLYSDARAELVGTLRDSALSTVWATLAAAAAQAGVMALAFAALGVPGLLLGAGSAFLLAWFPFVGTFPVSAAAALYFYLQGAWVKLGLMVGIGVVIGLIDNAVRAWILNGREDLHPLVSLVAVLGGISFFGVLGALVGPIFAAVAFTLLNLWPAVARRSGFSLRPEPAPKEPA